MFSILHLYVMLFISFFFGVCTQNDFFIMKCCCLLKRKVPKIFL